MTQAWSLTLSLLKIWCFLGYRLLHLSVVYVSFGCLLVFVCSEHLFIHGFCLLMKSGYCLLSMSALTEDDDNDDFCLSNSDSWKKKITGTVNFHFGGQNFHARTP